MSQPDAVVQRRRQINFCKRRAEMVAVIWLCAIIAHSDFSLKKAQSSKCRCLVLLISALINARVNRSLIKTTV